MKSLAALFLATAVFSAPALSKEAPAYSPEELQMYADMRDLEDLAREDKREFLSMQLKLTDTEAAKFWPVFEAHQESLSKLNHRRLQNITAYAKAWNDDALDDAIADRLATEALDIEKDEAGLMQHTYQKLKAAVPAMKAAHYLQLESKLRALVRFELAADIPVIQ